MGHLACWWLCWLREVMWFWGRVVLTDWTPGEILHNHHLNRCFEPQDASNESQQRLNISVCLTKHVIRLGIGFMCLFIGQRNIKLPAFEQQECNIYLQLQEWDIRHPTRRRRARWKRPLSERMPSEAGALLYCRFTAVCNACIIITWLQMRHTCNTLTLL